jgi:hypothetical protein
MSEQAQQLRRVSERIASHILAFCADRVGRCFYADDLRRYVVARVACSPASPDRVLRSLRNPRTGRPRLDYRVESRSESLYRVLAVWPDGKPEERVAELVVEDDGQLCAFGGAA